MSMSKRKLYINNFDYCVDLESKKLIFDKIKHIIREYLWQIFIWIFLLPKNINILIY